MHITINDHLHVSDPICHGLAAPHSLTRQTNRRQLATSHVKRASYATISFTDREFCEKPAVVVSILTVKLEGVIR